RPRAAHLRLRDGHHRRARQPVGHARWRDPARRRAGHRRQYRSRLAEAGRPPRLPGGPGTSARGPVAEGARMSVAVAFADRSSRIGLAVCGVTLIALAAAPLWTDAGNLALLAEIYAYVALASLWNLLAGYAGLVSVGQQAYVGLGAY